MGNREIMKTLNFQRVAFGATLCQRCSVIVGTGKEDAHTVIRVHLREVHPDATGAMYWKHETVEVKQDA